MSYLPAIIGLVGVVVGSLISALSSYYLKKKEIQLHITEKIFDKRIVAHEDALKICQKMRMTQAIGEKDEEGNAITYPIILSSLKEFYNFHEEFTDFSNPNLHWMDVELIREMNFVQDYMYNAYMYMAKLPSEELYLTKFRLKGDIIFLAENLENLIKKFFEKDIISVKILPQRGHHKLSQDETFKRIENTILGSLINLKS